MAGKDSDKVFIQLTTAFLDLIRDTSSIHVFEEEIMVIHAIFGRSITTKAADDSLGVERLKDEELVLQSMEVCKGGRGIHRFNSKEEAIIKVKGKGYRRKGSRTKGGAT